MTSSGRRAALLVAGLSVLCAGSTHAQAPIARPGNDIGTGQSLPTSDRASNITPDDTRSALSPRLPSPGLS